MEQENRHKPRFAAAPPHAIFKKKYQSKENISWKALP
jgi:hypothetical protein